MKVVVRKRTVGNIPLLEVVAEDKIYEPLPLIIYYHGWQTAKELVLTQGRKLAAKNFRVLLPDAANHGERKTKTSEIPSLTFWDSIQTNLYEFGFLVDYFENLGLVMGKIGVGDFDGRDYHLHAINSTSGNQCSCLCNGFTGSDQVSRTNRYACWRIRILFTEGLSATDFVVRSI